MNIINKLHILKDTAVIAREKFSQKFWHNLFQALERTINTSEDEKKNRIRSKLSCQTLAKNVCCRN